MIIHGAVDSNKEKKEEKMYAYPVYTRAGYALVAIADEEYKAQEYIKENDNHIRNLFYMKKEYTDPAHMWDTDTAYLFTIDKLCDANGYDFPSERKWHTANDYDKVTMLMDTILFDLFEINGTLQNVTQLLNLPEDVVLTLNQLGSNINNMHTIFMDEDAMENIGEIFEHLSYDKMADMVFDYSNEYMMFPEKYRTRKIRTIF